MTLPSFEVTVGDCVEVMRGLPECSVDAVVCDPPYGLEFMGKDWDAPWKNAETVRVTDEATNGIFYTKGFSHGVRYSRGQKEMRAFQEWCEVWAVEVLRVLKPGGHLLAFGGTRTFHRMTVAIEDAGFEVRDCLSWLYGSGFPKSMNVAKAVTAQQTTGKSSRRANRLAMTGESVDAPMPTAGLFDKTDERSMRAPRSSPPPVANLTDQARRWEGWGTALKPAWEPVVLARKPLIGTVAANVLEHGTGGLNIDGSRIGTDPAFVDRPGQKAVGGLLNKTDEVRVTSGGAGRWPANVLLDEDAAAMLDEQQEGASRFFYVAKASRRDRNEGLDGMPEKRNGKMMRRANNTSDEPSAGFERFDTASSANHHPTVKPTALMRHLVRLVTPPDGLILDPFCGSGSTGKAAMLEGFRFHGIEQDAEYAEIARRRIGWAAEEAARQPPTLGV